MGEPEIDAWLSHLANNHNVSINTQKTALNAIVFLYKQFLRRELGAIDFAQECIFVRETKGEKWRRTLLPKTLIHALKNQVDLVLAIHQQDLSESLGIHLPLICCTLVLIFAIFRN